jgi:predicted molibdopterin-dependent oxidoreductase YjgC
MHQLTDTTRTCTMTLDGKSVEFREGETIYDVAQRHRKEVPTLCYDPRLEPFGACRLCVVEVEGIRNPVASCTTKATDGMVVNTNSGALKKHRTTLLELVASENRDVKVDPLAGYASQELGNLLDQYPVTLGRFQGRKSGTSNTEDKNPFILRDYENCISCYRCVRVCAEQEGDHAINVMNRGFHTQIITEFNNDLRDSSCTFCGQCVATCPTGALTDKKAIRAKDTPGEIKKTRSVCPYCGVGCSVDILTKNDRVVGIHPAMDGPSNEGALCVKGQYAFDFVHHPDRLTKPLIKQDDGTFREAEWDEALQKAAEGFLKVREQHGDKAVYGIASGRAPHEAAYSMQKFIRAGYGTNYIDNCSRA